MLLIVRQCARRWPLQLHGDVHRRSSSEWEDRT